MYINLVSFVTYRQVRKSQSQVTYVSPAQNLERGRGFLGFMYDGCVGENRHRVLIVSYPTTLPDHASAFAEAGFEVSSADNLSKGLGAVGLPGWNLLVLGPTVPPGDRRRIEAEAKRRNSSLKIVLVFDAVQEKDIFANAFVDLAEGPAATVQAGQALLA